MKQRTFFIMLAIVGITVSCVGAVGISASDRYTHFRSGDIPYICSHIEFNGGDDHYPMFIRKNLHALRDLKLSCGAASDLTKSYLKDAGIDSRIVIILTTHEWNDWNNGHTMLEVCENGEWHLYDVSKDVYFTSDDGNILSFMELHSRLPSDDYVVKSITGDSFNESEIRSSMYYLKDIPYITDDDWVFYVPAGDYDGKETEYWWQETIVLPPDEFYAKFYGTDGGEL